MIKVFIKMDYDQGSPIFQAHASINMQDCGTGWMGSPKECLDALDELMALEGHGGLYHDEFMVIHQWPS